MIRLIPTADWRVGKPSGRFDIAPAFHTSTIDWRSAVWKV